MCCGQIIELVWTSADPISNIVDDMVTVDDIISFFCIVWEINLSWAIRCGYFEAVTDAKWIDFRGHSLSRWLNISRKFFINKIYE